MVTETFVTIKSPIVQLKWTPKVLILSCELFKNKYVDYLNVDVMLVLTPKKKKMKC